MSTYYCANCLTTFAENGERCSNLACGRRRPEGGWGLLLGPGDLLDRHYRIDRPLAVGGAGLTYLAREVDGEGVAQPPDLAIKVLYAARAAGAFLHRLSTEAQILQELNHENIVQLRGFVHRAGQEPYLVTLYEHGGNLTELVEQMGALPTAVAAGILSQVLSALDVAHQRGVVHRDLKPDNVLLRERVDEGELPHIRVADFGIAKVAGAMGNVTKHGTFVGTPEYAAPEQFEGMDPTPATDVFAAGALFVHLLTGRMPIAFSARTDIKTCREEWLAALPPRLEPNQLHGTDAVELVVLQEVLDHMMDVRPERRWTVQQVLARLDGLVHGRAELRQRETLELTGKPAPFRETAPGVLAEPTAAAYLDDDGFPEAEEFEEETGRHSDPRPEPGELPRKAEPTSEIPDDTPVEDAQARTEHYPSPTPTEDLVEGVPVVEPPKLQEPPVSEPTPDPVRPEGEAAEGGGFGGCFAALAGLGVAGVGVLAVGAVLVVLVLAGAAWQLGYFASGPRTVVLVAPKPVPSEPVPVKPVPGEVKPGDPVPANPVPGGPVPGDPAPVGPEPGHPVPASGDPGVRLASSSPAWRAVRDAFDNKRAAVSECGVPGMVIGTAWIHGGKVEAVRLDDGYASGDPQGCAEGALEGVAIPDAEGWVRFAL